MSLLVEQLTKVYGEQKAVDSISFSINKGEIVGFLGPNGAGKSTTMKMIVGFLYPDQGNIQVCGIDVKKRPLDSKKKIGYLPESNALYYDMYVKEYLDFIADTHGVKNKGKKIAEVISLTGLGGEYRKKTGALSKGYKQRVGLAACLLHHPEVLILDEPTSGLDPNQIIEIRQVIKDQGHDKVILFSSHILQEVEAICDRVIIINRGKIVADDTLLKLKKKSTANIIKVCFKESLNEEWISKMQGIKSIVRTEPFCWKIETNEPERVRRQLLELSLQRNLNIVSLHNEHESLEEVFRTLTLDQQATP
ncbi:MAG: gliding motility-associated ABC transporter ATP-binding subunit GldA [Flavisolibacter sp.]